MNIFYPVTAINRDGKTRVLNTVEDVRSFLRSTPKVGAEWIGHSVSFWRDREPILYDWILRDDRGKPIDPKKDVPYPVVDWEAKYYADQRHAAKLGLPIPRLRSRWKRRKCECREACGGNHHDARYGNYSAEDNLRENDDY